MGAGHGGEQHDGVLDRVHGVPGVGDDEQIAASSVPFRTPGDQPPPTTLTDDRSELAIDETFGPVVILQIVEDADEAVERANSSDWGLTAAVLAGSTDQGMDVARRLEAGIVHVNDQPVNDEPQMPFGGVKDSGWGRFGIGFAGEDFTELQWVTTRSSPRDYAL